MVALSEVAVDIVASGDEARFCRCASAAWLATGQRASARFNAMQLMGAAGVGIAAGAGTGIVTGLVGTAIV